MKTIKLGLILIISILLSLTSFISGLFFALDKPTRVFAQEVIEGVVQDIPTPYDNNLEGLEHFEVKSKSEIYFSNTTSHKILVWKETEILEFGSLGYTPGSFVSPTHISTLPSGDIFVYDSLKRLQQFDKDFNFLQTYNIITTPLTYKPMGGLSSLKSDLVGNLYALDYENNIIIKKSHSASDMIELVNLTTLGLTLNQNSKLSVSSNGTSIFLANVNGESNLYRLNQLLALEELELMPYNITSIADIAIDCANNLFILQKDTYVSKLHKFSRNTYQYESFLVVDGNGLFDIKSLDINIETGEIILFNNATKTLQALTTLNYEGVFTENIFSFIHPINYLETTAIHSPITIAKVAFEETYLLQTPYNVTPLLSLDKNQKVIVLLQAVPENENYAYVLYTLQEESNISGYILSENLEILNLEEEVLLNQNIKSLNNDTSIYKYPTSLEEITLGTIDKNQTLFALSTIFDIKDGKEEGFYQVRLQDNSIAYVRQKDFVKTDINLILPSLVTNAEITITDGLDKIPIYTQVDASTLLPYNLASGKRIYLATYDASKPYTQITFLNEEGKEVVGFVQTKYIKVYDNYNELLQAFLLVLICFVLVMILIIIKTKKPKDD